MEEFPSGQRGQTVNLLRFASMVRIHLLPPDYVPDFTVRHIFLSIHAGLRAFSVSKKDWCPITVIPVFRDICKAKRSFHLIFQAGNSAFLRLPLFFPVVGTVKVFGRYIDRLTKAPNGPISSPQDTRG